MNLLWRWGGAQQGGQRAIAARRCCGGAQFTVEPREQSLPLAAAHDTFLCVGAPTIPVADGAFPTSALK